MPPLEASLNTLTRRSFLTMQAWLVPVVPVAAYLLGLTVGLTRQQALHALVWIVPPLFVVLAVALPVAVLRWLIARAVEAPAEERLTRLLLLPQRCTFFAFVLVLLLGGTSFCLVCILQYDRPWALLPAGALISLCLGLLMGLPIAHQLERLFQPLALDAFEALGVRPEVRSVFWPRQSWYLPFTFAVLMTSFAVLSGAVIFLKGRELVQALVAHGHLQDAQGLEARVLDAAGSLVMPLLLVGGYIALVAAVVSSLMARRQARASAAVETSLRSLVDGQPRAPRWVSTDEVGDLAAGTAAVLSRLQELPVRLAASAAQLGEAGSALRAATASHEQSLVRLGTALSQLHATAIEVKRTSEAASEEARVIAGVAQRGEHLSDAGSEAVQSTLLELDAISEVVGELGQRFASLQSRARRLDDVASTVRELARQSNMLALNAAIEAVRSGGASKGFAVVAREMRSLADQSIQETRGIGEVVDALGDEIRQAGGISDRGVSRVADGLAQVRASGESLEGLGLVVKESSHAVRRIASAVTEQHVGVSQIFGALEELVRLRDETQAQLEVAQASSAALESVSRDVEALARRYAPEPLRRAG